MWIMGGRSSEQKAENPAIVPPTEKKRKKPRYIPQENLNRRVQPSCPISVCEETEGGTDSTGVVDTGPVRLQIAQSDIAPNLCGFNESCGQGKKGEADILFGP